MKLGNYLATAVAFSGVIALGSPAAADYPEKTITMVVPFGAGGSTDAVGRLLASEFEKSLGQNVVVRNETGAAGTIGAANVAATKPDGYTIGYVPIGPIALQTNLRDLPYGVDDFSYVCRVSNSPNVLFAKRGGELKTIEDVVAAAKKNPGKIVYVAVPGGMPHVSVAGMGKAYGVDMKRINGDSATAARYIAGDTAQLHSGPAATATQFDLDPIAVFGDEPLAAYPDVPTFKALGQNLVFTTWFGLVAPKGLPHAEMEKLEGACEAAVQSPTLKDAMDKLGTPIAYQGSTDFTAFVENEFRVLGDVITSSGITAE